MQKYSVAKDHEKLRHPRRNTKKEDVACGRVHNFVESHKTFTPATSTATLTWNDIMAQHHLVI